MTEDLWDADGFDEILAGLADARVDEAARSRSHRAWIGHQVEAEATLVGCLGNLATGGQSVSVTLTGGAELRGTVRAVGADVVALRLAIGVALVPLRAVMTLRAEGVGFGASGRVSGPHNRHLADVLADAASDRREVQIILRDGSRTPGQLRAVGVDMITLRVGATGDTTMVVTQDALAACVLLDAR